MLKLNAPSVIKDTSWIKPGKTTFPWWNDFFETGVPFKMGLNTETAKYYIDFCAEYGIPYHTLDGVNDLAWYGGPIVPYEGADITQGHRRARPAGSHRLCRGRKACGCGCGCTGKRRSSTWPGRFRSTARGASRA